MLNQSDATHTNAHEHTHTHTQQIYRQVIKYSSTVCDFHS